MTFDRIGVLRLLFAGAARKFAAPVAGRWQRAARAEPNLMRDVIGMGFVLAMQPRSEGVPEISPTQLAYDAGRRDLALEILALMGARNDEILKLMETEHEHEHAYDDDSR